LPFLSLALARVSAGNGRLRWRLELLVLGALSVASFAWRGYADSHPTVPPSTFATTFFWFALGMALAVASVAATRSSGRSVALVRRHAWMGWLVAAGAYVVICRGLGLSGAFVFFQHQSTAQDLAVYALSGVVALGLALPAAFERSPRAAVGRLLGSRVMAWLGLVSYGIYLYHQPIAGALNGGVRSGGDSTIRFLWLAPATVAIAVSAAALSYYLVERPALRLKERRAHRPAQAVEVAS